MGEEPPPPPLVMGFLDSSKLADEEDLVLMGRGRWLRRCYRGRVTAQNNYKIMIQKRTIIKTRVVTLISQIPRNPLNLALLKPPPPPIKNPDPNKMYPFGGACMQIALVMRGSHACNVDYINLI